MTNSPLFSALRLDAHLPHEGVLLSPQLCFSFTEGVSLRSSTSRSYQHRAEQEEKKQHPRVSFDGRVIQELNVMRWLGENDPSLSAPVRRALTEHIFQEDLYARFYSLKPKTFQFREEIEKVLEIERKNPFSPLKIYSGLDNQIREEYHQLQTRIKGPLLGRRRVYDEGTYAARTKDAAWLVYKNTCSAATPLDALIAAKYLVEEGLDTPLWKLAPQDETAYLQKVVLLYISTERQREEKVPCLVLERLRKGLIRAHDRDDREESGYQLRIPFDGKRAV